MLVSNSLSNTIILLLLVSFRMVVPAGDSPENGKFDVHRSKASPILEQAGSFEIAQVIDEKTAAGLPQTAGELRSERIARCLATYYLRQIDADHLRPWSIMHGLIAYGKNAQIIAEGKPVNAVEYLCNNGPGDGMRLLSLSEGKLKTRVGNGVQGHEGQLLAMLAQSGVSVEHPIIVEGKSFTVQDLVNFEKRGCRSGTELTFKLIGLSHYLEPGDTWTNDLGERWDMQRLIREEMAQPVTSGACGGSHRLMSLTYAVRQLQRIDQPLVGEWMNAARLTGAYIDRAWKLQNADGSFSTQWFAGNGQQSEIDLRLYTTGHTLEWLVCSLPQDQLHDERTTAAVDYLLDLMLNAPGYELDVGPRGHALHALLIYQHRAFNEGLDYAALMSVSDVQAVVKPKRIQATPVSELRNVSGASNSNSSDRRAQPRGVFRRR